MINKTDVEYVFTAACLSNSRYLSRGVPCCLLFARTPANIDLTDRELHREIAEDPQTQKYLGDTFMILPFINHCAKYRYGPSDHESRFLIATNEADPVCRSALNDSDRLPVTLMTNGVPEYVYGIDIRNRCSFPEKYIDGCTSCPVKVEGGGACPLMSLGALAQTPAPDLDIEDYWERTQYWKTQIGRFRAIGSTLTSNVGVPEAHRNIKEHDFTLVGANLEKRQKGASERSRYAQFQKSVCSQCSMKEPCWGEYRSAPRWCNGYYDESTLEIAKNIVKRVHVPFTGPELRFLLANSGELDKRVERRKCYGTLKVHRNRLIFAINPKTSPLNYMREIGGFQAARRFLEKYKTTLIEPPYRRMSTNEKAVLLELAQRNHSPIYHNGWKRTSYTLLYIESTYDGELAATYRWRNYNRGGGLLPWKLHIRTLKDIYRNFQNFIYQERQSHELCKKNSYY
ncbi:MAG: hypothetical protein DRP83_00340 [Planctomycetota bacterium]|nr:MAG: hypothetical protein DRP83_00340 [Planctomycetota bacterium]